MKKLLLPLFIFVSFVVSSQTISTQNIGQMAMEYYRLKDFEKAAPLFLQLYEEQKFVNYFNYYVNCLIGIEDFDEAEKAVKRQIRKTDTPDLKVTLGYINNQKGDFQEAIKIYDQVVEDLNPKVSEVFTVANAFLTRSELTYAEAIYLKGNELIRDQKFYSNLATVYYYQRNYEKMLDQYFLMLAENESSLAQVQGRLASNLRNDFDNSLRTTIKNAIIKRIQADPENMMINRLMIWFYVAEENYEEALQLAISLDKRTLTEEDQILAFSIGAKNNSLYKVAIEGTEYLLNREPKAANADLAKMENVIVYYAQFQNQPKSKRIRTAKMEQLFVDLFNDYGYNVATYSLVLNYAHFLAFSSNKSDEALSVVDEGLKIRGLNNNKRIELQTLQADIQLYKGDVWSAALLYSQIIERNQNNQLIDDVKMKKALSAYYSGNIIWAKGNLDALKASTSKLIANDAIELSMLISDNYEMDTIVQPIQLFSAADLLIYQNKDSLAILTFDSITTLFPQHSLTDDILMRKAKIAEKQFNYELSKTYYEKIISELSYSGLVDDALFKLAKLYDTKFNNAEQAKVLYKRILVEHSGSIYVAESRNNFRRLRGDEKF